MAAHLPRGTGPKDLEDVHTFSDLAVLGRLGSDEISDDSGSLGHGGRIPAISESGVWNWLGSKVVDFAYAFFRM